MINLNVMMDDLLFPSISQGQALNIWSTCGSVSNPNIHQVALENSDLNVHRVNSRTSHNLVTPPPPVYVPHAPPPDSAWEATYPAGSINPKNSIPGGFGFYLSGPKDFKDGLKDATEVMFSYSVMFAADWEWVKGGKLPGLCES